MHNSSVHAKGSWSSPISRGVWLPSSSLFWHHESVIRSGRRPEEYTREYDKVVKDFSHFHHIYSETPRMSSIGFLHCHMQQRNRINILQAACSYREQTAGPRNLARYLLLCFAGIVLVKLIRMSNVIWLAYPFVLWYVHSSREDASNKPCNILGLSRFERNRPLTSIPIVLLRDTL